MLIGETLETKVYGIRCLLEVQLNQGRPSKILDQKGIYLMINRESADVSLHPINLFSKFTFLQSGLPTSHLSKD